MSNFWDVLVLFIVTCLCQSHSRATVSVISGQPPSEGCVLVEGDICLDSSDVGTYFGSRRHRASVAAQWVPVERPLHVATSLSGHQLRRLHRGRRAVTGLPERLWPNATVPYVIDPLITEPVQQNILQAMAHWEKHTCLQFVNHTTQDDYIVFEPGKCGCCSFVGRKGTGRQIVTLSPHCAIYGVVVHELGHVIGFWHEHSRPDRDNFVQILTENVLTEKLENFDKKSHFEIDSLGQPYDYFSIMHYRKKTFSKNGMETMLPVVKSVKIGQRDALSPGDIIQARLLYGCPKPVCFEEFSEDTGNFSTPNYPVKYYKDHHCIWIIHALQGEWVNVQFLDFSVEKSVNCTFDYVEFRQGIDVSGKLIGRLCGEGEAGTFQSPSSMWIKFHSDSSIAMKGFFARYYKTIIVDTYGSGMSDDFGSGGSGEVYESNTLPDYYKPKCNDYLNGRTGAIKSPLVPAMYSGKTVECSWTIDGGSNATRILLNVDVLPTSVSKEDCMGDIYQQVIRSSRHDHHRKKSRHMGHKRMQRIHYHGERYPRYARVRYSCKKQEKLLLSSPSVMIQWEADINPEFTASYTIDYDECQLPSTPCKQLCKNTLEGYMCACKTGFQLAKNGFQCIHKVVEIADKCGITMKSERGKIRGSTEPMADCYWYISPPEDLRIQLTFFKFDVPSNISNGTCETNYLEILTGKHLGSKGRYCGKKLPPEVTTPSGSMALRLHVDTDNVVTMPYFSAKYLAYKDQEKENRCFHRLKASGNITSPGFPDRYPDYSMCVWRVSARSGHRVHMKFDVMDIEKTKICHFDFLEVRNGKHRVAPLIGRFCGRNIPKEIVSKGRHLWLMFLSDSSGSGKGFQAYLESQRQPDGKKIRTKTLSTKDNMIDSSLGNK